MTMREFWRYHSFKVILGLVAIQLVFFSWLQYRNHRPEAVVDEYTVYEGHSINCQPLRNDSDKDEEDEIILYSVDEPQKGKIEKDENKLAYEAIRGFVGVDSFAYTIYDGKKESKKAFIKITVEENLKPKANKDAVQMYQGQEIEISVLDNDEDRENDSIFLSKFSQPLYGEITQIGNKLLYKPNHLAARADSFHYTISDGFSVSDEGSVVLTILGKNSPCYPWLSADVGNPSIAGGLSCTGNSYELKASGADIWANSDNFHFAYQTVKGNCEIVAKLSYLENTNQWAKAGLMIRETLSGNSRNAFVCLTPENGALMQIRTNPGSSSDSPSRIENIKDPYWLKLIREGDEFKAFISPDGKNWTESGSGTVSMPTEVYIGLAFTSHDDQKIGSAKFDHVKTIIK